MSLAWLVARAGRHDTSHRGAANHADSLAFRDESNLPTGKELSNAWHRTYAELGYREHAGISSRRAGVNGSCVGTNSELIGINHPWTQINAGRVGINGRMSGIPGRGCPEVVRTASPAGFLDVCSYGLGWWATGGAGCPYRRGAANPSPVHSPSKCSPEELTIGTMHPSADAAMGVVGDH